MSQEDIACPECGTEVASHNLDRHYRRQHPGVTRPGQAVKEGGSSLFLAGVVALVIVLIVAVAGASWYLASKPDTDPPGDSCCQEGDEPPLFTGLDTKGVRFSMASHLGKEPVILEFIWTDCPHCRATAPLMNQAATEYGDQVQFVGLAGDSRDTAEDVVNFVSTFDSTFPHIEIDQDLQKAYGVNSYPTTIYIGSDGLVKNIHLGEFDSYSALAQSVRNLL